MDQAIGHGDIKAVLFDFDGTLWDPEPHIFSSYAEAFAENGSTLLLEDWSELIGTVGVDLWAHFEALSGGTVHRSQVEDGVHQRIAPLLAGVTLRPGVRRILDAVDAASLPRGIVSNSDQSWIRHYSRQCGIDGGWAIVHCADGDRSLAKPAPILYRRAIADLGIDAGDAIAFEDSPTGVRAATAAGIYCIAVPNVMTAALDLRAADLRVDSFEEIEWQRLAPGALLPS